MIYFPTGVDNKTYKGPQLESDITLEFMKEMLEWLKDQKILHNKYAYKIILQAKDIFSSSLSLVDVAISEVCDTCNSLKKIF